MAVSPQSRLPNHCKCDQWSSFPGLFGDDVFHVSIESCFGIHGDKKHVVTFFPAAALATAGSFWLCVSLAIILRLLCDPFPAHGGQIVAVIGHQSARSTPYLFTSSTSRRKRERKRKYSVNYSSWVDGPVTKKRPLTTKNKRPCLDPTDTMVVPPPAANNRNESDSPHRSK